MYNFFKIKNNIKVILSCLRFVFIINNAAVIQSTYYKENRQFSDLKNQND